jgi:hypothetical protein
MQTTSRPIDNFSWAANLAGALFVALLLRLWGATCRLI